MREIGLAVTNPVVSASRVTKRWGSTTALSEVSIEIFSGITGLLGVNGAGKTTFLSLLLGLHRPDEGVLHVLNLDPIEAGPEVRQFVGYASEHDALPEDFKAQDFVTHMAEVHGIPKRHAIERASDALWLVGLGEERFRQIGTMSTGQKQMVKIAQAVAHGPRLLLLDEPTNGLDPTQRDQMLTLIRRIGAELGIEVILASHLIGEVERICDRAIVLDGGVVGASETLNSLKGGAAEIVAVVDARVPEVVKRIEAAGYVVQAEGSRIRIEQTSDEVFDIIRDAVAAEGAGLIRLAPLRASLWELFEKDGEVVG